MADRNAGKTYSTEKSTNALANFFKEKYNAAVAAELRIRNMLDQLKGEGEDATLFQFFKTESLEALGYGVVLPDQELIHR